MGIYWRDSRDTSCIAFSHDVDDGIAVDLTFSWRREPIYQYRGIEARKTAKIEDDRQAR